MFTCSRNNNGTRITEEEWSRLHLGQHWPAHERLYDVREATAGRCCTHLSSYLYYAKRGNRELMSAYWPLLTIEQQAYILPL